MKSIDPIFAMATMDIASELMPEGFRVSANSPSTLESLTDSFHNDGVLTVSDWHGAESMFACPVQQTTFQAWHDWNHVNLQASFDPIGERRVHLGQVEQLTTWYQRNKATVTLRDYDRMVEILYAHNVGRLDYWTVEGEAPSNFRLFALGVLFARGVL